MHRSCVMRAAYLSQDRPDSSHAVKNLSRKMVAPTDPSLQDLKRLCRYLVKKPDISQVFSRQAKPSKLRVQVDSDHAGDAVDDRYDRFVRRPCFEARKRRAVNDCPINRRVRVVRSGEGWISSTRVASLVRRVSSFHFCSSGIRRYCCEGHCESEWISRVLGNLGDDILSKIKKRRGHHRGDGLGRRALHGREGPVTPRHLRFRLTDLDGNVVRLRGSSLSFVLYLDRI